MCLSSGSSGLHDINANSLPLLSAPSGLSSNYSLTSHIGSSLNPDLSSSTVAGAGSGLRDGHGLVTLARSTPSLPSTAATSGRAPSAFVQLQPSAMGSSVPTAAHHHYGNHSGQQQQQQQQQQHQHYHSAVMQHNVTGIQLNQHHQHMSRDPTINMFDGFDPQMNQHSHHHHHHHQQLHSEMNSPPLHHQSLASRPPSCAMQCRSNDHSSPNSTSSSPSAVSPSTSYQLIDYTRPGSASVAVSGGSVSASNYPSYHPLRNAAMMSSCGGGDVFRAVESGSSMIGDMQLYRLGTAAGVIDGMYANDAPYRSFSSSSGQHMKPELT